MQRIPKALRTGIVASILIVLLSACGGDDDEAAEPTVTLTPTRVPIAAIPTWTPVPTLTPPPPRPTADTSDLRPTETPFGFNRATEEAQQFLLADATATPVVAQPGATAATETNPTAITTPPAQASPAVQGDPNPTLTVTAEEINQGIAQEFNAEVGQTLASVPMVRFDSGQLVIEATVFADTDGTRTEAAVTVRANVLQVQGEPVLTVAEAFYTQDNAPYLGDLTGTQLATIEGALQDIVDAKYTAARPDDDDYYIAVISVGNSALTIQTVSLTD